MRIPVSGRDFQLRYLLYRLTLLALKLDRLHDQVARVRLEWPIRTGRTTTDVDAVLEDDGERVVEIVECREHLGHLPLASVKKFLSDVAKLRKSPDVSPQTRFRFVSSARFLKDGTDFMNPAARERALRGVKQRELHREVIWELGLATKKSLTAESVFHFGSAVPDPRGLYSRLYSRLAGQMSHRLQRDGEIFEEAIKDLHSFLFGEISAARLSADLSIDPDESFAVAELRNVLESGASPRVRTATVSRKAIDDARGRGIFGESRVTLDDIFIEPDGTALVETASDRSTMFTEPALSLLFDWVTASRAQAVGARFRTVGVAGTTVPLLVTGPFGSGKTSLLITFAARMMSGGSGVLPLFVPLRELKAAGTASPLLNALAGYVRGQYKIDILDTEDEICLLCDGFDELNLFFADDPGQQWVETGYRQLSSLAQRPNVTVVISSRPILLIGSSAVRRDRLTRVELREFDDERIDLWCHNYASTAGLPHELSLAMLEQRNLVEVSRTPIVLYMIARIVETAPELLEARRYTRAGIYRVFITWTERGGYEKDAEKHDLPANFRQILQDIAWHLFRSGSGMMRERELVDRLRETYGDTTPEQIPIGRNLLVAHMLTEVPATGSATPAGGRMIEFTHQSFREYLVAERIWRLLEPARLGAPLDPAVWIFLGERLLTEAKVQLLLEFTQELEPAEARALHAALDDTDSVHVYWSKWSRPVWARLSSGAMTQDEARAFFDTLGMRAAGLAVLSMILKIALHRRGGVTGDNIDGDRLAVLLSFLKTYPELGTGVAARDLLAQNLRGLRLTETTDLSQVTLNVADFVDCELANVYFDRSVISTSTFERSTFTNCRFKGAMLPAHWWSHVRFRNCDFSGAVFNFNTGDLCESVEFYNCAFDRASLGAGALAESVFRDCSWEGATAEEFQFIRGNLDRTAEAFFRAQNARLDGVVVVEGSHGRVPTRKPRSRGKR